MKINIIISKMFQENLNMGVPSHEIVFFFRQKKSYLKWHFLYLTIGINMMMVFDI